MPEQRTPWSASIFRARYPRRGWVGEGAHRRIKISRSYYDKDGEPVYHDVNPVNPDGSPTWGTRSALTHKTLKGNYAEVPTVPKGEGDGTEKRILRVKMAVSVEATYGPDGKVSDARVIGGHYYAARAAVPERLEDVPSDAYAPEAPT